MILPTKRLPLDRALLSVGGEILCLLDQPKTISRLWEEIKKARIDQPAKAPLTFDWFILALDFLFLLKVINVERGRILRSSQ